MINRSLIESNRKGPTPDGENARDKLSSKKAKSQ